MTIRNAHVAVIGAGVSGVVSGAHIQRTGADVTVFERAHAAGGNWLYDERVSIEPDYTEKRPSKRDSFFSTDFIQGQNDDKNTETVELLHGPPGPAYVGLTNNVSTRLLETTLLPFPKDTPDYVKHDVLSGYIQNVSKATGIDQVTRYKTRVEKVVKSDEVWHVHSSTFQRDPNGEGFQLTEVQEKFDFVVVASGHYHTPVIPELPGLLESKSRWPTRIWHSKNYRQPELFKDKKILLVGAGVSGMDIAKEASPFAKQIYQTHRSGDFDIPAVVLPGNASRIDHTSAIEIDKSRLSKWTEEDPLPLNIKLVNGESIIDIDYIILCTGYLFSLPFLQYLHNDELDFDNAGDEVLVTKDGRQIHNLHKDIFYIPDPTLIVVGVPFYTATFSLFDYQAIVAAAVISGKVTLPSVKEMRLEYQQRVTEKGYGRHFHSLKGKDEEYVDELLVWVNKDLVAAGHPPISGYSEEWHEYKVQQFAKLKAELGLAIT